jgi:hypothetical protein
VAAVTGLLLRCPLPPPLVELPLCAPEEEPAVASALADEVFRDLTGAARTAVVARYGAALRARRQAGTCVVAVAQGEGPRGVSASSLTLRLHPSAHDDAEATAAATAVALRAGGAEVQVVAVPLGPAAVRLRAGSLALTAPGGPVGVRVAVLDALVPLPGRRAAVALSMFCPTVEDLPRHTALAGTVLAGTTVVDADADPGEEHRATG